MVSTVSARSTVASNLPSGIFQAIDPSDIRGCFYAALDSIDKAWGGIPFVTDSNANASDGTTNAVSAIASAMATGAYIFTPGVYRISSNITLTGHIHIMPGATLLPASGVTVTIAGNLSAGRHRIFNTSLGGTFVSAAATATGTPTTIVYPEWWGATGTGVNCSPLIQSAINFVQHTSGGTVHLNGWYRCDATLVVSGRVGIRGQGPVYGTSLTDGGIETATTLDFSSSPANTGAFIIQNGSTTVNGFRMENLGIFRDPPEAKTATSIGLSLVAVQHVMVTHCHIAGFAVGVQVNDNVNASTKAGYDGILQSCTVNGSKSALIVGGCAGYSFLDSTFWSNQPNLDQIILIGRGVGGMKADTLTFQDCRVQYLNANAAARPQVLVRITDGMWLNFIRVNLEEALEAGILVQRDTTASHSDLSLKTLDVDNCWFNGVGRCVVLSGFRANANIRNSRMENGTGGTSCVAVEFGTPVPVVIDISNNQITNSGTTGGIVISNASGVGIIGNTIRGSGTGASVPGIVLASSASNSSVTANRVASNNAGPISNSGSNNQVIANSLMGA
jgi:hypothetical protein